MVYDEDLDNEIERAQSRLYYLRSRKKHGSKYANPKTARKKHNVSEEEAFYNKYVKGFKFTSRYNEYKEDMITTAKRFASFHNNVSKALAKYGTDAEKEAFSKITFGDIPEK